MELNGIPLSPAVSKYYQPSFPTQSPCASPTIKRSQSMMNNSLGVTRRVRKTPSIAMDSNLGLVRRISRIEDDESPPRPPKSWQPGRPKKSRPLSVQFDLTRHAGSKDSLNFDADNHSGFNMAPASSNNLSRPRSILLNRKGSFKSRFGANDVPKLSLVNAVKSGKQNGTISKIQQAPSPSTPSPPPLPPRSAKRNCSFVIGFQIELSDTMHSPVDGIEQQQVTKSGIQHSTIVSECLDCPDRCDVVNGSCERSHGSLSQSDNRSLDRNNASLSQRDNISLERNGRMSERSGGPVRNNQTLERHNGSLGRNNGLEERNNRSQERNNRSQERTNGSFQRNNGSQERNNGSQERNNGLQERNNRWQERNNGSQERNNWSLGRNKPSLERNKFHERSNSNGTIVRDNISLERSQDSQGRNNGSLGRNNPPMERNSRMCESNTNGEPVRNNKSSQRNHWLLERNSGVQERNNGSQDRNNGSQERNNGSQERNNGSQERNDGSQERNNGSHERNIGSHERSNKSHERNFRTNANSNGRLVGNNQAPGRNGGLLEKSNGSLGRNDGLQMKNNVSLERNKSSDKINGMGESSNGVPVKNDRSLERNARHLSEQTRNGHGSPKVVRKDHVSSNGHVHSPSKYGVAPSKFGVATSNGHGQSIYGREHVTSDMGDRTKGSHQHGTSNGHDSPSKSGDVKYVSILPSALESEPSVKIINGSALAPSNFGNAPSKFGNTPSKFGATPSSKVGGKHASAVSLHQIGTPHHQSEPASEIPNGTGSFNQHHAPPKPTNEHEPSPVLSKDGSAEYTPLKLRSERGSGVESNESESSGSVTSRPHNEDVLSKKELDTIQMSEIKSELVETQHSSSSTCDTNTQDDTENGQSSAVYGHPSAINGHPLTKNGHSSAINGHPSTINGHSSTVNGHSLTVNGHNGHSSAICEIDNLLANIANDHSFSTCRDDHSTDSNSCHPSDCDTLCHSSDTHDHDICDIDTDFEYIPVSEICKKKCNPDDPDDCCVIYSRQSGINVHRKNSHGQTALDIVNKFTPTRAASDIKHMLRDAVGGCQAVAIKDYIKIHDRSALSFKAGDAITILEKNANGKWKGSISKPPATECIGYFPAECVEIIERPASTSSVTHPNAYGHGPPTPTGQHSSPSPAYITSAPHHQYQQQQYHQQQTHHHQQSPGTMPAESFDQQQMQDSYKQQQNYYGHHQPGSPTAHVPPHQQHGMNGSAGGYAVHDDRYSHGHHQPDVIHGVHTMDASNGGPPHLTIPTGQRSSGGSPQHTPSPGSISPYGSGSPYQSGTPQNMSPRRVGIGGGHDGIWVRKGHLDNSGEESGVDVSSSTESMERKGSGSVHMPRGVPTIHMNVNTKPLGHTQPSHSFENMLDDRQSVQPGPRRPHSDSSTEIRVDPMRAPNVRPHYQGKDVDRIYEWLKRQRMGEYTNNFTKAGYDFPTIARMTPEDLTAIGITKPGHRKRISAMIGQLTEPDGIPNVRPPDVATWLKLLDLYQYYNTLISNGYNTMDNVMEITWEDLQDIGIIRLGHQKKLTLAISRLLDLKRRDRQHRSSASHGGYPPRDNSTGGSDAGSVSPHSSVDGFPPPPPPNMLSIGERRTPSMQSPSPNGNLITVKPKTGLRNSQESLGSDISNKSSGSRGSRESKGSKGSREMYGPRQDMYGGPRQIVHQRPHDHGEASYVPTVTNLRVSPMQDQQPSAPHTPIMEQDPQSPNQDMSFSTFKKPPPGHRPSLPTLSARPPMGQLGDSPTYSPTSHPGQYNSLQEGARLPSQKSSESLDRLLEECTSHMQKRNSIEGGSSISSSGSGDLKLMKKPKPPAPPKRSNSVITTRSDEHQVKTATIGRKKSMKQFREEMKIVRQEMEAQMAAAPPQAPVVKSSDIPEGYVTIKRSPSRKASQPTYLRSNSHDESSGVPRRPNSGGAIPSGHEISASELDQLHQAATRPLNLGGFTPSSSGQSTPSTSTPSSFSPTSKPPVAHKPPSGGVALNMAAHQVPPRSASHHQLSSHQESPQPMRETAITDAAMSENFASGMTRPSEGTLQSSATHVPHHSYVAQRKDVPPSPTRPLPTSSKPGAFKKPVDLPPPKVPLSSDNYERIEASLRENIPVRGRTPNFPSTSDTASISSGSTSVSTGSSDSGLPRSKGDRPSSVEMILKRQSGGDESSSSNNPLDGIWRPRSRHFPTQNSEDIDDGAAGAEEDGKVTANVTFRALKQQFLSTEKEPKGLITGRRPSKKSDECEYQQRRSFTDSDEHRQSPVCKNAPVSFDTLIEQVQSGRTETTPTPMEESHTGPPPTSKKPVKPSVLIPPQVQPKPTQQQPFINNTYKTGTSNENIPPPPALSELPPPPAPQEYPPPPPQPDLPPPPPPLSSFPPTSEAPLPSPPPAHMLHSKPATQQTVQSMPPAPHMAPPSIPQDPPRLPSMSSLPPPPPVPPVTYKKSPSKSKPPPQAPPKKKSPRQPVVSEGWDSSDTIKRKPVLTLPTQTKPKPAVKPPSPTKPKPNRTSPAMKRAPPSEDVDIYSQDLDMMDSMVDSDDVVDSDSSDTLESGLSGFENENTDTIKKQPVRLSPVKTKEQSAADSMEAQLEALKMTMEMGRGGEVDPMGATGGRQRRDSLGLGEATNQLESLLSSMVDDPLANFAAEAEAAATSPTHDNSTLEDKESKDLFNDIESMFTSLADDLDQMLI